MPLWYVGFWLRWARRCRRLPFGIDCYPSVEWKCWQCPIVNLKFSGLGSYVWCVNQIRPFVWLVHTYIVAITTFCSADHRIHRPRLSISDLVRVACYSYYGSTIIQCLIENNYSFKSLIINFRISRQTSWSLDLVLFGPCALWRLFRTSPLLKEENCRAPYIPKSFW